MGLPVGLDMDGRVYRGLFTEEFRQANPVRTVESWGSAKDGKLDTSDSDEALVEELRALGYLN